jgi:hypothetical protein
MTEDQAKQMNEHNEALAKSRLEKENKPNTHREKQKERKRH